MHTIRATTRKKTKYGQFITIAFCKVKRGPLNVALKVFERRIFPSRQGSLQVTGEEKQPNVCASEIFNIPVEKKIHFLS